MSLQINIAQRTVFLDGVFAPEADGGIDGPMMRAALDRLGPGDVIIVLNSPGGLCSAAQGVIDALARHDGEIVTMGHGLVASAAVHIFLCGAERIIVGNSLVMVHSSWGVVAGHKRDFEDQIEALRIWDDQSIDWMVERTGLSRDKVESLHDDRDHWFDPWQALDLNIATAVQGADQPNPAPKTASEQAQQDIARNAKIWDHQSKIDSAKSIIAQAAESRKIPRPAEQAARLRPTSAPIKKAAQTESDLRFDRWRRLQNTLDRQFAESLDRVRRIKQLTGVDVPRPTRWSPTDLWRLLGGKR